MSDKYGAWVIPISATPLARGDLATVVAKVVNLLTDHPGYRVTLHKMASGKVRSRESFVFRIVDGQFVLTPRHNGQAMTKLGTALQELVSETTTVLNNLSIQHAINQE